MELIMTYFHPSAPFPITPEHLSQYLVVEHIIPTALPCHGEKPICPNPPQTHIYLSISSLHWNRPPTIFVAKFLGISRDIWFCLNQINIATEF